MLELVVILTDFYTTASSTPEPTLPRLLALETLLARAKRASLKPDWRTWLAAYCGAAEARRSAAQTVAAAWGLEQAQAEASTGYWLATPVHYFAGLDSVHLHPAGLLTLSASEQQRLIEDFSRVFADSPWRLAGHAERELLLSGPRLEASGADPARFLGSDPSAGLARGAGAPSLRRLGSELEMWLHEHPVNRARAARGALTVSTLWPWGAEAPSAHAGPPEQAPAAAGAARLFGHESVAAALWQLRGAGEAAPLPAEFAALDAPRAVVLFPMLSGQSGLLEAFTMLEQRWLSPALNAVRARRLASLRVVTGQHGYDLRWWQLARFWRKNAPWWEALA